MEAKPIKDSRVVQTDLVLPNDTNNHDTLFGGILMKRIDAVASIAASRHARSEVITASTDSVDFLHPIRPSHSVCVESFVSWTGRSSMEVFVKVITEELNTGTRNIAATAFLTFVSIDGEGNPKPVPGVVPESEEEAKLHETGEGRAQARKERRRDSRELASFITLKKPWE
ncbi:acyl-CoA thioesterase [Salsuginibacillus kocurii]|uniref:acyl-CoA thioesterase n=1 Tax=Salsuginibacillus kocurii TaxID=427078 RepID=UPI00035FDE2B|nr:acyl-CoA thioesterase [Salsuginibacillus kocurii]